MKKLLFLIASVAVFATAMGQHQEFRSYGLYGTVDGTFMMNLMPEHDACEATGFAGYNDSYMLMGLTASAGWQWSRASSLGLGFSFLYDMNGSFSQIPLFLEYRTHYTHHRCSPYTTLQAGWSIPFGSTNAGSEYVKINQGGITFGAEVGMRVAFSRGFGMHLGVGYQMIQCREVERGIDGVPSSAMPELYHNLKATLGFNF